MNKIDLILHDTGLEYSVESVKTFCYEIMKKLEIDNWCFSLIFCKDSYIQSLNYKFRDKNEPTDILSFCEDDSTEWKGKQQEETGLEPFFAGDVFISMDSLKKNAENFNENEAVELKRLLIHGILHLKGYEHETNDKTDPMIKIQEKILNDFGDFTF